MSNSIPLQKLTELVGGTLSEGSPDTVITGLNSIMEAAAGEVTFLGNARYLPALKTTRASAALVPEALRRFNPTDADNVGRQVVFDGDWWGANYQAVNQEFLDAVTG